MGATCPLPSCGPDLGSFCRLDELGLRVVGRRLEPGRAVLACRVVETDEFARWCRRCGCQAAPRDSVTRRLAHEPLGWRPTTLLITIRRYRCTGLMQAVIDSVDSGVPATLTEIRKLGRTYKQRATDILALFDRPGTSNGPTEAINGRLEHLRGSALGFRNLTNYIARSLLEAGGFRPRLHPRLR
jgi:transposase